MKATLMFDLPQEEDEFMIAVHAKDFAQAIWDLREALYDIKDEIPDKVCDRLFEILDVPAMEYWR